MRQTLLCRFSGHKVFGCLVVIGVSLPRTLTAHAFTHSCSVHLAARVDDDHVDDDKQCLLRPSMGCDFSASGCLVKVKVELQCVSCSWLVSASIASDIALG